MMPRTPKVEVRPRRTLDENVMPSAPGRTHEDDDVMPRTPKVEVRPRRTLDENVMPSAPGRTHVIER